MDKENLEKKIDDIYSESETLITRAYGDLKDFDKNLSLWNAAFALEQAHEKIFKALIMNYLPFMYIYSHIKDELPISDITKAVEKGRNNLSTNLVGFSQLGSIPFKELLENGSTILLSGKLKKILHLLMNRPVDEFLLYMSHNLGNFFVTLNEIDAKIEVSNEFKELGKTFGYNKLYALISPKETNLNILFERMNVIVKVRNEIKRRNKVLAKILEVLKDKDGLITYLTNVKNIDELFSSQTVNPLISIVSIPTYCWIFIAYNSLITKYLSRYENKPRYSRIYDEQLKIDSRTFKQLKEELKKDREVIMLVNKNMYLLNKFILNSNVLNFNK